MFEALRKTMVRRHLARRGVRDRRVLAAMAAVPREAFLPLELREFTYDDGPLPIGEGQTISQPFIVAVMIEAIALTGGERVLDVGTGSGYAAAVIAEIAGEVYTVERHRALADGASARLRALNATNVHTRCGDGTLGWPEHAPYDAIVVAAGGPEVPPALRGQLAVGGRIVMPIGSTPRLQRLVRETRTASDAFERETLCDVRFVPLIGAEGWGETNGNAAAEHVRRPRRSQLPARGPRE